MNRIWVYEIIVSLPGRPEFAVPFYARTIGQARRLAAQETAAGVQTATIYYLDRDRKRELVAVYRNAKEE